jgi:hypothetical protein
MSVSITPHSGHPRQHKPAYPAPPNSPAAVKSDLVTIGQSALEEGDWGLVCLVDFAIAVERLTHA